MCLKISAFYGYLSVLLVQERMVCLPTVRLLTFIVDQGYDGTKELLSF